MPPAFMARFHHIRGVFMTGALQFLNVFFVGDALSVTRQAMSEDVGDQNNIHFFADGAHRFRWFSQMLGRANKFRMSITDRISADASTLHFINECPARELVVDNSDVTSQHVDGETHDATR
jgi:hypothetical protein